MPKNTVNDLINMDYNAFVQLTKKENIENLKSVVIQMVKVANRRINNLNKSEIGKFSPALQSLNSAGIKKFSTKGISSIKSKDVNKLVKQYSTLKSFLSAKTSTISGWNRVRAQIAKRTGATKLFQKKYKSQRSATIWHNREKRFWKLYNQLVDNYGGIITQLDSDRIQSMLMTIQNSKGKKTDEQISEIMNNYVQQLYEAANKGEILDDGQFEKEFRIKF